MPPVDQTPQSVIRYLTRLLCALADHSPKGELRIKQSHLNELAGEGSERALFETFDAKSREVVLQFRPKSLATYLIEEPQCPSTPQTIPMSQTTIPPTLPKATVKPPLTDEQLARAENQIHRLKVARAIKNQRAQSSNPLEGIL